MNSSPAPTAMPSKSFKLSPNSKENIDRILSKVLPVKNGYSLNSLEQTLKHVRDNNELLQRRHNDKFDAILFDGNTQERLTDLSKSLNKVQLGVMKLQCDIAFTQEQCKNMKTTCDNPLIIECRELIANDQTLSKAIHQAKFNKLKEFFDRLAISLSEAIVSLQKSQSFQTRSSSQFFNWPQYHQAIYLLRVCGKAVIDINMFERLYQSNLDIASITFRQTFERPNFNDLIDTRNTYSLESLIEITTSTHSRLSLKDFLSSPQVDEIIKSQKPLGFILMESLFRKFENLTQSCCNFITDLNLNYIEAYLTEGINIDKLNNCEDGAQPQLDQPTLPDYAFSPQDCITQIGQHLLNLRKQTEQYDTSVDQPLQLALKSLQVKQQDTQMDLTACITITETILKCIVLLCIRSLLGRTSLSVMTRLSPNGRLQLATDAKYLDDVFQDLGVLAASHGGNIAKFKALTIR